VINGAWPPLIPIIACSWFSWTFTNIKQVLLHVKKIVSHEPNKIIAKIRINFSIILPNKIIANI